jgi:predicted acylesterase/phospholipase RssA
MVRAGSPLKSFSKLKQAIQDNRVRFLLVDRLSSSGHLAQRHALLHKAGITLSEEQIEYTYSHTASLARLAKGKEKGKELVAFVFAGASPPAGIEPVSDFPGLDTDEYTIPQNVWVARPGFEAFASIQQLLETAEGGRRRYSCKREEQDRPLYQQVGMWADELGAAVNTPASLDEIGWLLRHYKTEHGPQGARLALVLSGGGAKCSYQAGALQEIEKKLGDEIRLVVGTSGGALNAVPVALGVTNEEPEKLAGVWSELDLRDLARPAQLVCIMLALWIACLVILLLNALRQGLVGWSLSWKHRLWAVPLLLASTAVLLFLFVLPWLWGEWIDRRLWLRYSQILLDFGWGRWVPGLTVLLWLAGRALHLSIPTRPCLVAVVLLPGFTLAAQLHSETLFEGAGMKHAFALHYAELTGEAPTGGGDTLLNVADQERLAALSRIIVNKIAEGGHPRRDLVITGSCLPPRPTGLDSDLYFFLPAGKGRTAPRFGSRGHALADHPDLLLEVVMGSGTIYPAFPASTVKNFPEEGQSVELIDGGFAHNSPVEAAVQWGATHILLVEASPRSEKEQNKETRSGAPAERHGLLYNMGDAFTHLYDQAQLLDARSREKVAIFTLRPKKWHLTVVDFSRGLIRDAIAAGKADAAGASFERQYGEPRFIDAQDAVP